MYARILRPAINRWLLCLAVPLAVAVPARAALPEVGQEVRNALDIRLLRKIPLPPGRWKVEAAFEESARLTEVTGRLEVPIQVLVLSNGERQADIALLVLEFTDGANVSWSGQPCDTPNVNAALMSNAFGTTGASLNIRCNRIFAFDHFRREVQLGSASSNAWQARRFARMSSRATELPVHTLLGTAYLSVYRGDRVWLRAYANPALHGLDAAPDGGHAFRSPDKLGDRAGAARSYLKSFADWFDAYTNTVQSHYLEGQRAAAEVPRFQFGSPLAAATPAATRPEAGPVATTRTHNAPSATPAAMPSVQATAPVSTPPTVAAAPPRAPRQAVHALVIGNSAYPGAALPNPANDARAIAQRFRAYGFEVTMLLDGTRKQMVEAMSRFADSAQRADVTIVFYAGHGLQLHGVNYLIPVDLNLDKTKEVGLAFEAVSLNTLLEDHLPGKAKLVFVDACRDNPLARSLSATRGSSRGLAPMNAATGTLISYATRDGSTAADGTGANSPYTTALLAHIDEAEDISIVLRRVRQKVMDSTRGAQQPWEYGSLIGDKLVLSQLGGTR